MDQLAEALSGGDVLREDGGEENNDGQDNTILQGNLDLEAAGLTKDTLRRLVLASYVTQATVGTELGIEISFEELEEMLSTTEMYQLLTNNQTDPDNAGYYYVRVEDEESGEYTYYTATRGSVRIENEDEELLTCVNNATFDYYIEWFNGNKGAVDQEAGANTVTKLYTVREIGSIEMITVTSSNDGSYSFSSTTINYAENSEISECMVPIELFVDFLQISASPDFLEAFEKLIVNQEITLRVYELTTTEEITTIRRYTMDIMADARKTLSFRGKKTLENGNVLEHVVTDYRDLTYDLGQYTCGTETVERTITSNYEIKLISADTWYFKAERNVTKNSLTMYEYYDENGEATSFTPESAFNPMDNVPEYSVPGFSISGVTSFDELQNRVIQETGMDNVDLTPYRDTLNSKLQDRSDVQDMIDYYTDNDGYAAHSGMDYKDYVLETYDTEILNLSATAENGTEKKMKRTRQEMLTTGTMDYEDNTDAFLGLWKNALGMYVEGLPFDPDGEKVPYFDLYEQDLETAYVGDLFENADEMLFDILEYSDYTQSYSAVMKYILYRYTGKDYGVTDFETLLRLLGLLTVSTGDYNVNTNSTAGEKLKIVDTDDGVSAEQHLIDGINSVTRYRTAAQNYLPYVDTLIELQERYGVNAAWIVAQGCLETGGGATGSAVTNNNWYGLGYNGSTYYSYSSPEECFEDMARTVAQTGPYFRDGRETITEISYMWVRGEAYDPSTADPDWWYVADGKETVRDILTGAGVDVSGIMGGEILEVCAQVTDHYNAIGAVYSVSASGSNALIWGNIDACWDHPYICCATYVSMVLYQSGLLTADQINAFNYHYTGAGGVPDMLEAAGWHKVPASEMQPGDVLNRNAYHVMIYAGNGQVWDQNTCTGAHYSGPFTTNISGYDVWRAP